VSALLSIRNLTKSFYGSTVLRAVDLDVAAGEVHALLGQNGSGKSTLIKCLAGYHAPDPGGSLTVAGRAVELPLDPRTPRILGLSFVHQQLSLARDMSVLDNLSVGRFATGFGWRIRWRENARRVRAALARVQLEHVEPRTLVGELSEVEQALVAIARALQDEASVLVLDEPTASLPRDGVAQLFSAIRSATAAGAGVLFVTHRLEEVHEVADRVTVLRDGVAVATAATAAVGDRELVELIVGRPMEELYPAASPVRDDVALSADDVSGSGISGFSVRVHRGEVVGLTGLVGMGHDAVPYLLFGAAPATSGTLAVGGVERALTSMSPSTAIGMGIGFVPGDRLVNGGVADATAKENISLTILRSFRRHGGWIDSRRERRDIGELMRGVDVRPPEPEHLFAELSGGNQQKVVLAKWFATKPNVLLMHEPTQGVDVGSRHEVFAHVREFTDRGGAVLLSTTDHDELAHVCDRVVVFRDGRPVAELSGDALTSEAIVEQAFLSDRKGAVTKIGEDP
jgi:ribose transport system ATP-binding protein